MLLCLCLLWNTEWADTYVSWHSAGILLGCWSDEASLELFVQLRCFSSLSFSSRTESTDFSSSTRSDTQLLTCFLNVHLLLFWLHSLITKFDFINIYDLPLNLLYSALSSWHDLTGVDARWCHCFHISLSVWKTISMHVFNTEFILFCQFNTSSVKVTNIGGGKAEL